MIADMNTLLLDWVVSGGVKNYNLLWGGLLGCAMGCGFFYSGLTRRPLRVNPFNPWNGPISVRAARLVRDIVRALW